MICETCNSEFEHKFLKRICPACRVKKISKTMSGRIRFDLRKNKVCKRCRNLFHRESKTDPRSKYCHDCRKLSVSESRRNNQLGKTATPETRRKMRLSAINHIRIFRGPLRANVGKTEKSILDKIESETQKKISRQFYLTDLGYIVDGYCPETNTVYEVYESWHKYSQHRDELRKREICSLLGCNFEVIQC